MSTPIPAWLATPEDVAAVLRARTKDDQGVELGAWTSATRPTLVEVEQLIALAATQITDADGPGTACSRLCRAAVTYQTACLIELSYFPEQVRSDRSPYTELKELLDAALQAFDTCLSSGAADGGAGGEGYTYHSLPAVPLTTAEYYPLGWRYPEYPATWQRPCFPPTAAEPATVLEPEPPPEPIVPIIVGHPAEGDPARGLPPIITQEDG